MISFDEAMKRTAAEIAKHVENVLVSGELMLRDHGATEEEVATFLAWKREEMDTWATETLAEIRRGLSDFDAPSAKLQ
jgi:hypothetical protein